MIPTRHIHTKPQNSFKENTPLSFSSLGFIHFCSARVSYCFPSLHPLVGPRVPGSAILKLGVLFGRIRPLAPVLIAFGLGQGMGRRQSADRSTLPFVQNVENSNLDPHFL